MEQPEQPQPDPVPAMQQEFLISDLETVRIIADPIRLRILELLALEAQPVKRLAATLAMPQTKLYYHINLLEEHGLLRVVGTRVVSGIIEKQYGATARSYRIDDALLTLNAPGRDDTVEMMLTSLLDGLRNDMQQALAADLFDLREDAPDNRKITLGRAPLRLTPERAAELHKRLTDLITEYCPNPEDLGVPAPGTKLYHLFIACFPTYVADEQTDQS